MIWSQTTLGELVEFQRGHDLPLQIRDSGSVPVIGSNGINGTHSVAKYSGPGVAIGRSGVIGGAIWVDEPYWPLNTVLFVKDFRGTHPRWLYYLLKTIDFKSYNSGSVQPSLNRNYIVDIAVAKPPLNSQIEIANLLSLLDARLDSNLRAIEKLERLGAALLEREIQHSPDGRPIEDSKSLGEFLDILETGSRPKGGIQLGQVGVVSLGAQHIQSAGICKQSDFGHVSLDFATSMKRGHLAAGDVLVYKDGGKPGNFIPHVSAFGFGFPVREAVINEHVYRVRSVAGVSQALLYWVLRSPWLDMEMRKRGTGVAIPGLNSTNLRNLPFPLLSDRVRGELNATLGPMFERVLLFGAENVRISELLKALIPELISGRLQAGDAAAAASVTDAIA